MTRWTDPNKLNAGDRIQTRNGETVTLSSKPEPTTIKRGDQEVPGTSVSGTREGTGENYRTVLPASEMIRKVI